MRATITQFESRDAFISETRPLTRIESGDLATEIPHDAPLPPAYRNLLSQTECSERRAQILNNGRQSYHSEAAELCRMTW